VDEIRDLVIGEHRLIGDISGESFADDPVNKWIFGSRESMTHYYTLVAKKLYLQKGFGHVLDSANAGTLWLPPGIKKDIPVYRSLDIAASMVYFGSFRSVFRGMAVEAGLVAKKPKEPHFFLFAIGTRPSEQGKGLGSQVMAEGLKIVDQANMPAYLESSKEQNIPFYKRFGFEIVEKTTPAKDGPPLWLMWRESRSS
jgi:ribosomal protein S18 acetylase RimI-like enzyme